jgi:DNA-binding response OmpR family regulator
MKPALFLGRKLASDQFKLEFSDQTLRSAQAFVYLTKSEARILAALIEGSQKGTPLDDIPSVLGHEVSAQSIHIVRTHISKLKAKLALISESRVEILLKPGTKRYFLVEN